MSVRRTMKELSREQAMDAVPLKLEIARTETLADGGLRLTVNLARPKWHRWFGGKGDIQRSFELDEMGADVYNACDGKCSVKTLIRRFAADHNLALAEAEMSVTQFLHMLMARGLVGMEVGGRQEM